MGRKKGGRNAAKPQTVSDEAALRVKFGNVQETGTANTITISAGEGQIDLFTRENVFKNAEMRASLTFDPNGQNDDKDQTKMFETTPVEEHVLGAVHGFSTNKDRMRFTITIPHNETNPPGDRLGKFANKFGEFRCKKLGQAKTAPESGGNGEAPQEPDAND